MTPFLEELAARRRFGMKPGLETIRALCDALASPQRRFAAIHVAGTNGKGAVCAILDAALRAAGLRVGRYTSPHLVKLNERFFLDGAPVADATLDRIANRVNRVVLESSRGIAAPIAPNPTSPDPTVLPDPIDPNPTSPDPTVLPDSIDPNPTSPDPTVLPDSIDPNPTLKDPTFFEALTAVAFLLYAEAKVDCAILECGLGGRLDATNVCEPKLCVITKIGLDHCDWLGDTVEKIAAEKAGIVKPGVPVVLGKNLPPVVEVVRRRAAELGAPFHYAPDLASEDEIPSDFSLVGSFNRENAVTALAALKVWAAKGAQGGAEKFLKGFGKVIWPGRFQKVGNFIVDGAHNPPAARALAEAFAPSLAQGNPPLSHLPPPTFHLICGFCGDKDVDEVLSILAPLVKRGFAVRTNNSRSLSAEEVAAKMRAAGVDAEACPSLEDARRKTNGDPTLVCGSLFLAGEALVELGAYPWGEVRYDPSETLKV